MTHDEYLSLLNPPAPLNIIRIDQLLNKTDRTLIYGYTLLRETFHVYLKDMSFVRVIYNSNHELLYPSLVTNSIAAEQAIPNKRVYPERCDYEFCSLVQERGLCIPYTTFDASRLHCRAENYYGLTLDLLRLPPDLGTY